MKKILILVIVIGLAVIILTKKGDAPATPADTQVIDPRNSSFMVEKAPVKLTDGVHVAELASIPGAKITTRYFGNEIFHDLDNDGREDAVFIVTQDGGGSGTFYYVVAVLNKAAGETGSNSYLLGDRIAPQSTNIDEGTTSNGTKRENVIVVNFAVREKDEPMTAPPSVGKSVWLKLDPVTMEFGVVSQDFEGETK